MSSTQPQIWWFHVAVVRAGSHGWRKRKHKGSSHVKRKREHIEMRTRIEYPKVANEVSPRGMAIRG